ncbi:MAG: tetratricopeptide repeat protein [Bacteroidetes bacterium]|nr:tetratricopeptide repeat protein [Bacteroidota bacterium]
MRTKKNIIIEQHTKLFGTFLFFVVLLLNTISLFAQSSVIGLRFNGQNVLSANVTVMPPGKGGSRAQINKGDGLISGTRLIIPPGTTVILQSPGGKQICSSTKGKTMEYTVKITPKSENHFVRGKGAQVKSTVTKSVGYNYRVNNGRGTTSAARGTEFTFTDMSEGNNEQAIITTEKGSINIIDKVPVTIGGKSTATNKRGKPLTKAVSRIQNEGDGLFTSSNYPVDYDDIAQAISYVADEINFIEDPEARADNLLCLGDLFMDYNQPQNAIDPFSQAMLIFEDYYGEEDLDALEAKLSFAEALVESGNQEQANLALNSANEILQELVEINIEDLNYITELEYIEPEDDEAYEVICDELMEIYGLLGWVYEIADDEATSNQYYNAMENGCR